MILWYGIQFSRLTWSATSNAAIQANKILSDQDQNRDIYAIG